jgi:hypothetical protein
MLGVDRDFTESKKKEIFTKRKHINSKSLPG